MPKFRVYGISISEDMFVAAVVAGSKEEARRKAENGEYEDIDYSCEPKNEFVIGNVEKIATNAKGGQDPQLPDEGSVCKTGRCFVCTQ